MRGWDNVKTWRIADGLSYVRFCCCSWWCFLNDSSIEKRVWNGNWSRLYKFVLMDLSVTAKLKIALKWENLQVRELKLLLEVISHEGKCSSHPSLEPTSVIDYVMSGWRQDLHTIFLHESRQIRRIKYSLAFTSHSKLSSRVYSFHIHYFSTIYFNHNSCSTFLCALQ